MNTPEFIRVGGVLYRAKPKKAAPPPKELRYAGALYRLAARPQVQSHAANDVQEMLSTLHESGAVDASSPVLQALKGVKDAILKEDFVKAREEWVKIKNKEILALVNQLKAPFKQRFTLAVINLDDNLIGLTSDAW